MVWELILAILCGVSAGTFTGILPGIHINLVAAIVAQQIGWFDSPLTAAIFVVALAITHTIIDFIPAIFIGAAEEDTALATLPGHTLMRAGQGEVAVQYAVVGTPTGIILSLVTLPLLFFIGTILDGQSNFLMVALLTSIVLYCILRDTSIINATLIVLVSGLLGFTTLNIPVEQPLLPLLTGLFGIPMLIASLKKSSTNEKTEPIHDPKPNLKAGLCSLVILGPLFSILPALGSGYAATIAADMGKQSKKGFLFLNGAINSMIMFSSFIVVYIFGKARTGAAATTHQLIQSPDTQTLLIFLSVALISSLMAAGISSILAKHAADLVKKIPYHHISRITLVLLILIVLGISGWKGLLVLGASTGIGMITLTLNVKRINMMGCLLGPTLFYYITS